MKLFKHITLVCILFIFGFSNQSKAQIDVSINPLPLIIGSIDLAGEFALNENMGVQAVVGFASRNFSSVGYKITSLKPILKLKYYINPKNSIDGLNIFGFARYVNRNLTYDDSSVIDYSATQNGIGLGIGVGYKFLLGSSDRFVIDLDLGFGYNIVNKITYKDESVTEGGAAAPKSAVPFRVAIGYRIGG